MQLLMRRFIWIYTVLYWFDEDERLAIRKYKCSSNDYADLKVNFLEKSLSAETLETISCVYPKLISNW